MCDFCVKTVKRFKIETQMAMQEPQIGGWPVSRPIDHYPSYPYFSNSMIYCVLTQQGISPLCDRLGVN